MLQTGEATDDLSVSFCDMSKEADDTSMETTILSLKKQEEISFGAVKNGGIKSTSYSSFTIKDFTLLYETGSFGSLFNNEQGVFTAPTNGVYQFTFSGTCHYSSVKFYVRNKGLEFWENDSSSRVRGCGRSFLLRLNAREEVSIDIRCDRNQWCLYDSSVNNFYFFGRLAKKE